MPRTRPLLYVHPGPLPVYEGSAWLSYRTVSGLEQAAQDFPGDVILAGEGLQDVKPAPDTIRVPFSGSVKILEEPAEEVISTVRPGVVSALHVLRNAHLLEIGAPLALVSEVTRSIRTRVVLAAEPNRLNRARITAGSWRQEIAYRRMARRAAGLLANGPAAWSAYGRGHRAALAFHDHRITLHDVERAMEVDRGSSSTFRVAFSGRLVFSKGAHLLTEVARRVAVTSPHVEFVVLGSGEYEDHLRSADLPNLQVLGFKEFRSEWVEYVQQHVDLMLLPHLQGDPSCTFFEAWGSGAPVLGFEQETLSPVIRQHGIGWAVPYRDVTALAEAIDRLAQRPAEYHDARARGLELIHQRPFEKESARRMELLARIAAA